MQKEAGLTTLFTCAAGAIGLFVRWLQLSSVFDPENGLPARGSAATIALVVTILFYAGALFIIVRSLKNSEKRSEYREALRGRSIFYPLVAIMLGTVTIIAAISMFFGASHQERSGLWRVLAIAAVFCGASYPLLSLGPKRGGGNALTCLAAVIPTVFFCVWLVISYMINAADPVIWNYAIEILATSGAVLGFYYYAGYAFGRPRPLSALYFSHLGAFFCMITVADAQSLSAQIIFGASAVMLLMLSTMLVGNFEKIRRKPING